MFKKWFGFGKNAEPELEEGLRDNAEADDVSENTAEESPEEQSVESAADQPEDESEKSQNENLKEESVLEESEAEEALVQIQEVSASEEYAGAEDISQDGGLFGRLFSGLDKTRKSIVDKIDQAVNNYGEIDDALYDEIEEILISADVGMETTLRLVALLREEMKKQKVRDTPGVHRALATVMESMLIGNGDHRLEHETPAVYLVIGVNGAGKTTSIGKMAHVYKRKGDKVLLAAADTFRAAAIDQLRVWAERTDTPIIAHKEGSDPAAVVFDGIQAAKARNVDILICDTAGRLHNKKNLMNELAKIFKIVEREWPEAHREVLLVLDATTGQNAVQQARLFKEVADISGIILTKLDGTARGGVVLAIRSELDIPVKLIGVGEGIDDLQPFSPHDFVKALIATSDDATL